MIHTKLPNILYLITLDNKRRKISFSEPGCSNDGKKLCLFFKGISRLSNFSIYTWLCSFIISVSQQPYVLQWTQDFSSPYSENGVHLYSHYITATCWAWHSTIAFLGTWGEYSSWWNLSSSSHSPKSDSWVGDFTWLLSASARSAQATPGFLYPWG